MTRYYLISSSTPQKQIYIEDNTFKIGSGKDADLKIDRPSVKDVHLILFPKNNYCIAQGPDCYILPNNDISTSIKEKIDLEMNCKYDYAPNDTIGLKDFTFTIHQAQTEEPHISFPCDAVQKAELKPKRSTIVHTTPGAIKGADLNINVGSLDVQSEVCPVDSHGDFIESIGEVELVRDCGVPATIDTEHAGAALGKEQADIELGEKQVHVEVNEELGKADVEVNKSMITSEAYVYKEETYQEIISPVEQFPIEDELNLAEPMGEIPALKTDNYNVMGNVFMDTPSMASENIQTPVFMDNFDHNNSKYTSDVISDIEQIITDKEREFEAKTSVLFGEIEDRVDLMEERIDEVTDKINEIKKMELNDTKRIQIEDDKDENLMHGEKDSAKERVNLLGEDVKEEKISVRPDEKNEANKVENLIGEEVAVENDRALNETIKDLTNNENEEGFKKRKLEKEMPGEKKAEYKREDESVESVAEESHKKDDAKKETAEKPMIEDAEEEMGTEKKEIKEKVKKDVSGQIKEKKSVGKKGKVKKEAPVKEVLTDSKEDIRESSEKKGKGRGASKKTVESSEEKKSEEKKGRGRKKTTNVTEEEKKPAKIQKRKSAVKADIPSKKKK